MEKVPIDQHDPDHRTPAELNFLHFGAADDWHPGWKPYKHYWGRTIPLSLAFIAIAISSEVILFYSQKNSGRARDSNTSDETHSISLGFDINLTAQFWMVWLSQFRSTRESRLIRAPSHFRQRLFLLFCLTGSQVSITPSACSRYSMAIGILFDTC